LALIGQRCTKVGYDPVLRRRCSYSAGAWFDLREHGFEPMVGPRSFGCAGLGGAAVAFCDVDRGICVSWRDYRVHESVEELLTVRSTLTRAVYRAFGVGSDDEAL
jgi:hypothetical protein